MTDNAKVFNGASVIEKVFVIPEKKTYEVGEGVSIERGKRYGDKSYVPIIEITEGRRVIILDASQCVVYERIMC